MFNGKMLPLPFSFPSLIWFKLFSDQRGDVKCDGEEGGGGGRPGEAGDEWQLHILDTTTQGWGNSFQSAQTTWFRNL